MKHTVLRSIVYLLFLVFIVLVIPGKTESIDNLTIAFIFTWFLDPKLKKFADKTTDK